MGPFTGKHPFITQSEFRAPLNHSLYIALFEQRYFMNIFIRPAAGVYLMDDSISMFLLFIINLVKCILR